jgi:hypothetical protein
MATAHLLVALLIACCLIVVHFNVLSSPERLFLARFIEVIDSNHKVPKASISAETSANQTATSVTIASSLTPPASALEAQSTKFQRLRSELRSLSLRYYIYDDPAMGQAHVTKFLFDKREQRGRGIRRKRYQLDAEIEIDILNALSKHPLRIKDPENADLFIFPLAVGANVIRQGLNSTQIAFAALLSNPHFRRLHGHQHVILSFIQIAFDYANVRNVLDLSMNPELYQALANVTIARDVDVFAVTNLTLQGGAIDQHDYATAFQSKLPVTHSGFSLGLGAGRGVPFLAASWERFQQASNLIFYQTRREPSLFRSTRFRHAPLSVTIPNSSIGLGLNATDWLKEMKDSKFCLAIRGDTPHTHALMRAVKVGCIPVIISDYYPIYAPTLKSTLSMEDYCIFIPEDDFIANPEKELMALANLTEEFLRTKIEALQFAQQVALHDSPDSLFVPAFLKEAQMSINSSSPDLCVYNWKQRPKVSKPFY